MSKMLTIQEEAEEECSNGEGFIRGNKVRESLSSVQPKDRIRNMANGWVEYVTPSGRLYYYNQETREKSWKPPRKVLGGMAENDQSRSFNLSQDSSPSRGWESIEFVSTNIQETKPTNIGKILRTGILKTTVVELNGEKVKKKWVRTFVVLTEFYILFTTIIGNFKKLFKKAKPCNPTRHYLLNAEVMKCTETSKCGNLYRFRTSSSEILFRSKKKTVAESWFHAITFVINNLKEQKFENACDLKERVIRDRANSSDFGVSFGVAVTKKEMRPLSVKSVSLSDFSLDETDGLRTKCLSDFFGSKYPTPPGWIAMFDSETQQFCYVNCITKKKWFRALTDDGHPYFYEEGWDKQSWVLPSIYLDVNSQILNDIRKSSNSCHSSHSNIEFKVPV